MADRYGNAEIRATGGDMNNSSRLNFSKLHGEHEYSHYENSGLEPRVQTTNIWSADVNSDPLGAATGSAAPVPPRLLPGYLPSVGRLLTSFRLSGLCGLSVGRLLTMLTVC